MRTDRGPHPRHDDGEPAGTDWLRVALAIGAGVVAALQVGKAPPALPDIRRELGIDMVAGGWIASLLSGTTAFLGIAAGLLADRIGPLRFMFWGFAAFLAGGVLGALAWDFWSLALGRLLDGIGFVAMVVAAPALITRSTAPADRHRAIGIWSAYLPAGFALALLVAPVFLDSGWRSFWWANVAVVAFYILLFWRLTRAGRMPSGPAARPRTWREVGRSVTRPGPWLLAFCFLLYSLQWYAVMTWLPSFLIETQGYTAAVAALVGAFVVLGNVAGNLGGTWLLQRGARRWQVIVFVALVMAVTGSGLFMAAMPPTAKLALAFLYSMLSGMTPAAVLTGAVAEAASLDQVATNNGVVMQGSHTGSLLGAPALALVVALGSGWSAAPWLFLVTSTLSIVLALALRRIEK